jgi:hypothetical protein
MGQTAAVAGGAYVTHLHAVLDGLVSRIASLVGVVDQVAVTVDKVLQRVVSCMQAVKPPVHCLQHLLFSFSCAGGWAGAVGSY